MLIVGLTGGIGAGKTSVAACLAGHGATVIDVDALGREVLEPNGRAAPAVAAEFGDSILAADGQIDRVALARTVFGRPDELSRLTAISHPAINAELVERIDRVTPDAIVILDMAILVESNLGRGDPAHSYRMVVTVEAPLEVRVARAVARGMREDEIRRRIASQATDEERRRVADFVIANDGNAEQLAQRVDAVWAELVRRSLGVRC
jgi:dephospho-CoA kinase